MSHDTPAPDAAVPSTSEVDTEAPSAEFAAALAAHEQHSGDATSTTTEATVGSRVHARVVSVGEQHLLVDFGGRSEGAVETRHFRADDGTLKAAVGDEMDLYVIEAGEQVMLAPSIKAESGAALGQVRDAQKSGTPVSGKVTAVNSGGLTVDVGGVRGFCPMSQIELGFCADPSGYVGRMLEFVVTSVEEGKGGAVLSRRTLLRREEQEKGKQRLATLKVGDELDGRVARLEAFGAFIDLGGLDGMVHVSEVSHSRVGHPKEVLRVGEGVKVKVIRMDAGKDGKPRVALSIKAATPDPWETVTERFQPGMRVEGIVARLADFGAFVTVAPGVDGLVHVSEAALQRVGHVKEVLAPGDKVEAIVREVDPARKRIALSIREALGGTAPEPRTPTAGEAVEGRVSGVQPYGVFVDLPEFGPRVTGLLPREETGEPRGADLASLFPMGRTLTVHVIEVKGPRIRLSLNPDAKPREERPERRSGPRAEGGGRGERGPRGDRGPRREGGDRRDRGPRGGAGGERTVIVATSTRPDNEPTTMALALRKAMEEARRKAEQS